MADAQLTRVLNALAEKGDIRILETEDAEDAYPGIKRAVDLGFVYESMDDFWSTYRLTQSGREECGLPPAPSILQRALSKFGL